jgi:hypothetical protein
MRKEYGMTYRFHHIHLLCSNLEATIDFFVQTIGARLVGRKKFGGADGASLNLNGTTINLRVAADGEAVNANPPLPAYLLWLSPRICASRPLDNICAWMPPIRNSRIKILNSALLPEIRPTTSGWHFSRVRMILLSRYCNSFKGIERRLIISETINGGRAIYYFHNLSNGKKLLSFFYGGSTKKYNLLY